MIRYEVYQIPEENGYMINKMAERRGFEPLRRVNALLAFQASPFSLLGTPPEFRLIKNLNHFNMNNVEDKALITSVGKIEAS